MILIGRYRSPFTRRVAIALRHFGMPYEHRPITAWTHLLDVRALNPAGRIPSLILDSGEVLFDSTAILDHLDQIAGPERALVPAREPERREVLRIVACAMGGLEKIVAALYEVTMHPPNKVHEPWLEHNEGQARSALQWLDALADPGWLALDRMTLADVTTVATFDFARIVNAPLVRPGRYPALDALSKRCNALPAFAQTLPVDPVDVANPTLPV
jgi:glutathione S-transferase